MGARCCRAVHAHGPRNQSTTQPQESRGRPPLPPELFRPDRPAPPAAGAGGLRRPAPVRARRGDIMYEKLAESTENGIAEYGPVPGAARHAWGTVAPRAEK